MQQTSETGFINSLQESSNRDVTNNKKIKSSFLIKPNETNSEPNPIQELQFFGNEKSFQEKSSDFALDHIGKLQNIDPKHSLTPKEDKKDKKSQIDINEIRQSQKLLLFSAALKEEDEKKSLGKQVSKIKYFWRGTNMNYPFAFQKIKMTNKKKKTELNFEGFENENVEDQSDMEDDSEEGFVFEEDLSNKMINPTEKFYK